MKDSTSRISRVSRKLKLRLMLILVPFMFHSSVSGQLVISQYVETNSGSSPKGIEVWNASCSTIDFSTDTLEIFQATNGSSFFGQLTGATVSSGTLGPGEVLVIGTSDIGAYLTSVGLGAVTYVSYGFTFNGDDALEIRLGGVPQDRFGTLGVDPGAGWSGTCGATIATNNTNLELLPTVTSGDTSGFSDPCSRFTELNQGDSLLGFGVAPALPLCISPFPVNEFCEGSDLTLNYNSTQTTFTAGNVFNVELSNATGNFAAPLVIGSLADVSASGTINATIPLGQSPGTGYRIRIVSSNPATVGLVYESDITIGDAAEANAGPDISVCGGEEIGLGGTLMGSASSALWVGGTGQFPDGRNDPMGSYIPNQSEWGTTVTLQLVTNDPTGVCPADADTIDIEVLETPLLGAFGQVGNTCPTDSFDLTTLTVVDSNNTTGFLTYFDNTFNVLPSSWVTTTGIYYVFKTVPNPDTLKPDCFDFQPVTVIIQSCSCPAPTVTLDTAINVVCNGEATGAINVSVTGGSAPYIYAWSNGATTEDISGLVGDSTYTLTVYGADSCAAQLVATITQPDSISASAVVTDVSCAGAMDGAIDVTVNGGTPGYTFAWSVGTTGSSVLPSFKDNTIYQDNQFTNSNGAGEWFVAGNNNGSSARRALLEFDLSSIPSGAVITSAALTLEMTNTSGGAGAQVFNLHALTNNWGEGASNAGASAGQGTSALTPDATWFFRISTTDNWATAGGDFNAGSSASQTVDSLGSYTWSAAGMIADVQNWVDGTASNFGWILIGNESTNQTAKQFASKENSNAAIRPSLVVNYSLGTTTEDLTAVDGGTYSVTITDAAGCTKVLIETVNESTAISGSITASAVSCATDSSLLDLTVVGGTAPFSYAWSTGEITEDIYVMAANTYSVIITDANGCADTASSSVNFPAPISFNPSTLDVSCPGANDGGADPLVSGGTMPYASYLWSNASTNPFIFGVAGGGYTVTVTDANGCIDSTTITIAEPPAIVASETITNVSCNGLADGSIDLNPSGGTPTFSFLWSTTETTEDISGLTAGTYTVTITDAIPCTATFTFNVIEPAAIVIDTVSTTANLCNGDSIGAIDIIVTGGTPGVTVTEPIISEYIEGSGNNKCLEIYNGTSSDMDMSDYRLSRFTNAATTASATFDLSGIVSSGDVLVICNGGSDTVFTNNADIIDGFINHNGDDRYLLTKISTGDTIDVFGKLDCDPGSAFSAAGNGTQNNTLIRNSNVQVGVTSNPAGACNSGSFATLGSEWTSLGIDNASNLGMHSGPPSTPYGYSWSNGSTDEDQTELLAGTYTVIATDIAGCTQTAEINITEPNGLTVQCVVGVNGNINCNGGNDGAISSINQGGTIPYSYQWKDSNGLPIGSNLPIISSLTAGTYTLVVTDANGCMDSCTTTLTEPAALSLTLNATNISCFGANDGQITSTVAGGTPTYFYSWSNSSSDANLSNLLANTFTLVVTDDNSCTISASESILEPAAIIATAANNGPVCTGETLNLSVTPSASSFSWSGPSSFSSTMQNPSFVATTISESGDYIVVITDGSGCTASDTTNVIVLASPELAPVAAQMNSCPATFVDLTAISIVDNNATAGSLSYFTDAALTIPLTTPGNVTTSGVYYIQKTTTSMPSCSDAVSVTVTIQTCACIPPSLSETNVAVSCNGGMDGSIDLTVNTGTAPYTYMWSNNETTEDISGLAAGTYTVTVMDAQPCTAVLVVQITEPLAIVATCSNDGNVSCSGGSDGAASVSASGGTPSSTGFTYAWSNGASTASVSGLTAGTHSVIVTDSLNCSDTCEVMITEPSAVTASCNNDGNVSCNGGGDGSASVTAGGGTGPYTYLWSTNDTTPSISGLSANTYTVTVTDANNCSMSCTVSISEPAQISITTSLVTNASCNGVMDGAIDIAIGGGTPGYTYAWSNGASIEDISALSAGDYVVTVTDMNFCVATSDTITVTEPDSFSFNSIVANISCSGAADGSIIFNLMGGTPAYSYNWSDGSTTKDVSGLSAGAISVIWGDANGCMDSTSFVIVEPDPISSNPTAVDPTCFGGSNGYIDLNPSGGTAPYTFAWSDGSTNEEIGNLSSGFLYGKVFDANGCEDSTGFTLIDPAVLSFAASVTNVACNGDSTGAIDITSNNGGTPFTAPADIFISEYIEGSSNSKAIELYNPTASPVDLSDYTITLSVNGGTVTNTFNPMGILNSGSVFIFSPNNADAAILAVADTVFPFPSVAHFNGDDALIIENTSTNTIVDIFGNVGCDPGSQWQIGSVETQNQTLIRKAFVQNGISVDPFNSPCDFPSLEFEWEELPINDFSNLGTHTIDPLQSYIYSWSTGSTNEDVSGLAAGVYTLSAFDANGCLSTTSLTVNEPSAIVFGLIDVDCTMGAGSATVTVQVTNPSGNGLAYQLLPGGIFQTSNIFTGVANGTYTVGVMDTVLGCSAISSSVLVNCSSIDSCLIDSIAPVVICPSNAIIDCNAPAAYTDINMFLSGGGQIIELCNIDSSMYATSDSIVGICPQLIYRTYSIADVAGNSGSCTQLITVQDTAKPVLTIPGDVAINCDDDSSPAGTGMATATDNCGAVVTFSDAVVAGTCPIIEVITRTWTATDSCNNTASAVQTITVKDTLPPTPVCMVLDVTLDASGTATITPADIDGGSSNSCGGAASLSLSKSSFTCADVGNNTVVLIVTDACGNIDSCAANVVVKDNISPVANCQDITVYIDSICNATISASDVNNNSSDACGIDTMFLDNTMFGSANIGTGDTILVDDVFAYTSFEEPFAGNQYADTGDAAVDHPLVNNAGQSYVNYTSVGGELGFSSYYFSTGSSGLTDGDFVGGTTFTGAVGSFTDGIQGFQMSDTDGEMETSLDIVNVAGLDSAEVSIDLFVAATGWETSDALRIYVVFEDATELDLINTTGVDIDGLGIEGSWMTLTGDLSGHTTAELRVSLIANAGNEAIYVDNVRFSSQVESTTNVVTLTVVDNSGNSSTCTALVTVLDTIAPVAPAAPANITVACATDIPAPVDLTATDACDGAITSSPSGMMIPGTCSNQFTMIRTWTFTDNSSNSSSVSQTIIVNDSIAPVAAAPADITVACVSDIPAPTTLTALDNCGDSFTVSPTGMILPYTGCSNQMTMVRTWTFADSCGNSASVSQNIIVNDSIAPTPPAAPVGKDFECASDIPNPMMLTAVDNCGDSITVMPTDSTITGSCPHDFTLIRTWTFTDSCGNSSSVSQTFNVNDTIDPVVALHDTSLVIGASGSVSIASSLLDAGTTDNCTTGSLLPPFTITPATLTFTCANVGENKVGITFTDECGNSASDTATITILSDMMASVNPNPANTCEGTPVQLNGNPSGGSGTYTHTWTGDVVQLDATNIENPTFAATSSGAFNLTYSATDANGCSVSDSVVVSVNALPLVVCTQDSVDCFGGSTGSATVAVSGGSAPYSYSWSPGGATAETATNLSAGTYTAVVTDALGCSASCTVTVLEPNQMLAFAAIEDSITCFGADDGVLAATAFGGNGNYVYTWVLNGTDTIAVGDTVNNMPTGTYTVYVSDGNGCSTITGVFLPEPPQIIVTETHVNVLCFGESTGSIDLTVSGGTAPYTYIWSNNATSEDISSLVAGPYTVTVTDNRGCTVEMQIIISENPPIVAGTSQSNVLCHGSNDGTATVFVSGGVGPYTYSWNSTPVQTTQTAFSLMAGNYQVTITDAVGCTKVKSFDILEPALLDASASVTNVSCNGANDGTATITQIIGGIPPYLVIWNPLSNPDTANSISGLAPGTYTAQVSDSNWCVTNVVVTITQPQQLFCQMITSPITCPGGNDGKLTAVISGGTAPYTYVWSNGATDAVNTGLTAGTYTVTVTDDNGCSTVCSGTIIEPQALSYNIFVQDVNCAGANDGKIIVNVAGGGTPPYSYTWNTVPTQTTSVASNLGPGMYTLIITDAAGCITTITETVNENPAIVVSETLTNVTCNGGNDGEINLAISGGVMPYTILWSNGNTTMNNSGLSAGTYAVTITDSVGCVYTNSYVINEPGPIVLSAVITNASCNASSTGSITVTPSGGNGGPYTYLWSDGQTTMTAQSLPAGTYNVTVTGSGNCTAFAIYTITEPLLLEMTANVTNVTCAGGSDGSATAMPTGGTAPYSYLWSNGQLTQTANGLVAGPYTVQITDANGCVKIGNITITEPDSLSCTSTITAIPCNGQTTGAITVNPVGGTAPYTYVWSTTPVQTTSTASGLPAGNYTVTITDNNGCTIIKSFTLAQPGALTLTTSKHNVSCKGGMDGTASVAVSGGTGPYTYAWSTSPIQTTSYVTGLTSGFYTVTVTDAGGCTAISTVNIRQPSELIALYIPSNPTCNGAMDGSINLLVAGGTAPYTFLWSDGSTGEDLFNVGAGIYYVSVVDNNGCAMIAIIYLTAPSGLNVSASIMDVSCAGGNDGGATVFATGGMAPYSYLWSNGQVGPALTNVIAGSYDVTVTDVNGCSIMSNVTVNESNPMSCSISVLDSILCYGNTNGKLQVNVTGGTAPYTYTWSTNPIQNTAIVNNLGAGMYSVIVTDANGCTTICSVTLTEPAPLTCVDSTTPIACHNDSTGTATVTASGGIAPYTYLWSTNPVQTAATAIGLSAGNYTALITDANGCTVSKTITIVNPPALQTSVSVADVTCNGLSDGSATVTTSGGAAPYAFAWSDGQSAMTAVNLAAGSYSVTVTDANGCSVNITGIVISEPGALSANPLTSADVTCFGFADGTASISNISGGTAPYVVMWNTSPQQFSSSAVSLSPGMYTVLVTDQNGCSYSDSIMVGGPSSPLAITVDSLMNIPCVGGLGYAAITAGGGTPPYMYLWSNGQTTATATGLNSGSNVVTVTDANNCVVSETIVITQPGNLTVNITGTDAICSSDSSGTATATVNGGTAPYTYVWLDLNGDTAGLGNPITNLIGGAYTLVVTDMGGCTATGLININEPTAIFSFTSGTDVTCNGGNDGTATVQALGGTGLYNYLWSDSQSTQIATGLTAGSYTVIITDVNGCSAIAGPVIVSEPLAIQLALFSNNPSCYAGTDGSVSVSPIGGTAPYNYVWNTGVSGSVLGSVGAGTYTVTVTDYNGCTNSANVTLIEPDSLSCTSVVLNPTCYGGSNGGITITPTGGTPGTTGYSISWSTVPVQTTATITGLNAGQYFVTITDSLGCSVVKCIKVIDPVPLGCGISIDAPILCNGDSTGVVTAVISGGVAPYSYLWNTGDTTATLSNLSAGSYDVTIIDANGCIATCNVILSAPNALTTNATFTNPSCGINNGTAQVSVSGGTAPYSYLWSTGANSSSISGLGGGSYIVTVMDANNCTVIDTVILLPGGTLSCVIDTMISPTCAGFSDGSITVVASGGDGNYTYSWSTQPTQTTATAVGLAAGTYFVTITDGQGCSTTCMAMIVDPAPFSYVIQQAGSACAGSNQDVTISVSGGTAPYSYMWSDGQTTATAMGLAPGNYVVQVTDANGCVLSVVVTVTSTPPMSCNTHCTNATCGQANGTIIANVFGGTAPYSYVWSDGQTNQIATGLAGGTYSVIITDANGCTTECYGTVADPGGPVTLPVVTDATCNGGSDGNISVANVTGGVPPYTFQWSDGQSTPMATNLVAGTYTVTITDVDGCSYEATATVDEPAAIALVTTSSNIACYGLANGSASVSASGGMFPYFYQWSNGQLNNSLTFLDIGAYTVTVTDFNGCSSTASVTITQPDSLSCTYQVLSSDSCGNQNGSATIIPSGGAQPYTFVWSNGQTSATASGLVGGSNFVTIIDANGCQKTECVKIPIIAGVDFSIIATDNRCAGDNNADIDLTIISGGPATFLWSNGATTEDISNLSAGTYYVTVTGNGCSITNSVIITDPAPIVLSTSSTDVVCAGVNNGTASVTVSGGTPSYSFMWSTNPPQFNPTATGLSAGTYVVTVSDQYGCTSAASAVVGGSSTPLNVTGVISNVTCKGGNDGAVDITVTGGTAPYSYLWHDGSTMEDISGLSAGPFAVTVTDSLGCVTIFNGGSITEPPLLVVSIASVDVTCNGINNGAASANAAGGTAPYSYLWNTGATTQTINNLVPGNYSVVITDANGCTEFAATSVAQPSVVIPPAVSTSGPHCPGELVSLTAANGYASYSWVGPGYASNVQNPQFIGALANSGLYTLTVSDSNGCTASATINVDISTCASVGDLAWIDLNGNGLYDAGEPVLGGVTVTLHDSTGAIVDVAVTDSLGNYLFTNVAPGDYYVTFGSVPGYTNTVFNPSGSQVDGSIGPGTTPTFTVNNTDVLTIDAGYLGTGTIGDYVWQDLNNNGLQDDGNTGIPGVVVQLTWLGPDGILGTSDDVVLTDTTDANGGYLFPNLPMGDFEVMVLDGPGTPLDGLTSTTGGNTTTTSLTPGAPTDLTQDFGYIGGVNVGDFTWIDVNGNGLFDAGEIPVGGVTVNLHDSTGAIIGTIITDSTGMYLFTNILPGDYYVTFGSVPGYTNTVFNPSGSQVDGSNGPGTTPTFTVGNTDVLTIDAGYLGTGTIGDYVWEDLNNNGLQDDGNTGIPGVVVQLTWLGPDGILGTADDVVLTDTTDANGGYSFPNLPMGDFEVMVMDGTGTPLDGLTSTTGGNTTTTSLTPGAPTDLTQDFGYVQSVNVGDFTWIDVNGNGLFDAGDFPVGGVTVTLHDSTGAVVGTMVTDSTGGYLFTDVLPGDYYMTFGSVPGYGYTVYNPSGSQVDGSNGPGTTPTFTVSNTDVLTIDQGYLGTGTIGDYVWEDLNNNGLQDDGNTGIPGVVVQLTWLGPDGILGTADDVVLTDTTGANGGYLFPNLPMGDFEVMVMDGPGTPLDGLTNTTGGNTTTTSLTPGAPIDLTQDFGYVDSVNVGDFTWIDVNGNGIFDAGEIPVGGVTVTLHDSTGAIVGTMVTDSTGAYLFTDVLPGDYYVTFGSVPGYGYTVYNSSGSQVDGSNGPGTTPTFTVANTDVLTIDQGYLGTGTIGDYVWEDLNNNGLQDDGNTGFAGVVVQLTWLGPDGILGTADDVVSTDTTDANGGYLFPNLPMGDFEVMVLDGTGTPLDGYSITTGSNTTNTTLTPGAPIDLTQDFGYVNGVTVGDFAWKDLNGNGLFDAGELPLSGVSVTLHDNTGALIGSTVTDSTGMYMFTGVLPGDYYVTFGSVPGCTTTVYNPSGSQVDGSNGPGTTPTFTVGNTDVTTIDAGYIGTGTIGDYVWEDLNNNGLQDDGNTGFAGVIVELTWYGPDSILGTADDVVYIDTTDSNGGYLFTDLPMGDYQVMVLDGTGTPLDGLNNTTGGNTTNTALTPGAPIDLTQDFGYYLPVGGPLVCSTTGSVITCGTNTGTVTVNVTGGVPPYNYFWNTNPPQTTQTATNLPAGTYLVQVTDQTGSSSSIFCFATITCSNAKNSSAISNDENNDWSIMVYPNPTDGAINLNYFADEEQRIVVEFRDMTGRVVHAVNETATLGANQHRYDLSSLPKGIYFIIVQNKDARKVERIVLH